MMIINLTKLDGWSQCVRVLFVFRNKPIFCKSYKKAQSIRRYIGLEFEGINTENCNTLCTKEGIPYEYTEGGLSMASFLIHYKEEECRMRFYQPQVWGKSFDSPIHVEHPPLIDQVLDKLQYVQLENGMLESVKFQ